MNKELLVKEVTNQINDATQKDIKIVVETVFDTIKNTVASDEKVNITGFGSFESVERAAKKARNPHTGEEIMVAASKAPKFKASKIFKDAVNV